MNNLGVVVLNLSDTGTIFVPNDVQANRLFAGGFTAAAAGEDVRTPSIRVDSLTATRPVRSDGNLLLISGQTDLGNGNDVKATGVAANDILQWSGAAAVGIAGLASGVVTEVVSPSLQPCVTSVALSGVVPPGLTLTVTFTPQPAVTATAVNNHIVTDGVVTT